MDEWMNDIEEGLCIVGNWIWGKDVGVCVIGQRSFLLASSFLGVLLALSSGSLIGSFFFLGLLLSLKSSLLLLHDLLVLLDGLGIHLDGGVAETTIISIPVLSHEGAGTARGAGLALLGDVALA